MKLTPGCVRWVWDEIVLALTTLKDGGAGDPYMAGIEKLGEDDGKKKKSKSSG
jgi:hypothetical protein